MLALMEPLKPALDADEAATTCDVTYAMNAEEFRTIQIPVSVSFDGAKFDMQCPPVAIPTGTWTLEWNFTTDSTVPEIISISELMPVPELSVSTQPTRIHSLQWRATCVNNLTPPNKSDASLPLPTAAVQPINGCGYYIQVQSAPGSPDSALRNFTLAAVQTEILIEAGESFKVTYPRHLGQLATEETPQITVSVSVSLSPDSPKFVIKCPPAALPIGSWNIVWNFDLPVGMRSDDVAINLSTLVDVTNYFGVGSQPVQSSANPTEYGATGTNQLPSPVPLPNTTPLPGPISQPMSAFGYSIKVAASDQRARVGWIQPATHDPSIAVVQDPIVG